MTRENSRGAKTVSVDQISRRKGSTEALRYGGSCARSGKFQQVLFSHASKFRKTGGSQPWHGTCVERGAKETIMVMKCPRCSGDLEITGFDGSAIHTRCITCNVIARPKSNNPKPIIHHLSPKLKAAFKRQNVPVIFRRHVPC